MIFGYKYFIFLRIQNHETIYYIVIKQEKK
jgi:hypothetical protein